MKLTRLLVALASIVIGERAEAADFVKPTTDFTCRWAASPIVIDGKLDDPAWKSAEVIDQFHLPWLGANARMAKTRTVAKLLWDREYLYFSASMDDADLFADVLEHDGMTWKNDVFELFLKPAADKPGYYEFQVNAAGTKLDMYLPARIKEGYEKHKADGVFHMDVKLGLDGTLNKHDDKDKNWVVEGRIPWSDLMRTGGRPEIDEVWKFALCRYDYTKDGQPELSTVAPLGKKAYADFHAHEDYANLKFVGPAINPNLPPGLKERVPLTTSTVVGSPDPPLPYRVERAYAKLGLTNPMMVKHLPGTKKLLLLTNEKRDGEGEIRILDDKPDVEECSILLNTKGLTYDFEFHPKFAENGFIYLGTKAANDKSVKSCRVTRYTMSLKDPIAIDEASAKIILEWESDGHDGCAICFGRDGMMYVTTGDGTSDSDANVTGQRMDLLLAKLLRIDVDHPDEGKTYSVPKDNPFVTMKDARPETWALGFRNPWRITCDAKTGHIWVGNNGQDLWEQVYFVKKGDNFGWSVYEGSHPFYLERKLAPAPHTKATLEHHHSEARSLTGGIVYYGKKHPDLVGAYIYGDYSTGRIWAARHDGTKVTWHKEIAQSRMQIAGFGTDADGEILICDHDGKKAGGLYTLVPTPKDLPPSTFPKKLSDSGLFTSVKGHQMQPGMIPYSVNSPLWSDGAIKARWLGLPTDAKFDYNRTKSWAFPEQTVIVKSFALELEEGKPETRKWIETRFFTKQGKEWYGYSYRWNDEQTDATLVEAKGDDGEYAIKTPAGQRVQKWHYPSRSECMVCHSRAANWVLGLSEAQINRDHDYGNGCVENQLTVLERLKLIGPFNYAAQLKEITKGDLEKAKVDATEINALLATFAPGKGQRTAPTNTPLLPLNPDRYSRFPDPYDTKADLNARARAYLHTNCASCHVQSGGGNSLFDTEWRVTLDKTKLVDVKPVHHTFDIKDPLLIAPGAPERSVLLHRISNRDKGHMPPLATTRVDDAAVALIREWIRKMPARKDE